MKSKLMTIVRDNVKEIFRNIAIRQQNTGCGTCFFNLDTFKF